MNKFSIRLTSFLLAFFSFVLILQNMAANQEMIPLNTSRQFDVNIANTLTPKEQLALDLDKIVDDNEALLVKVSTPPDDYESKKDIIFFGSKKPVSNDLVIEGNKINWLDAKLTGELLSSKNIGNRSLYGTYATDSNKNFDQDLEEWAMENGVDIEWMVEPSLLKNVYYSLVHKGTGNVILTDFLLFVSSLIAWFVLRAKGRSIRLLGGVKLNKIHIEDTWIIAKLCIPAYITAFLMFLFYIGISRGVQQIPVVITENVIILCLLIIISLILTFLISIIVKPKPGHIAKREIPLQRLKKLSSGTRILSIVLALIIVPVTLTAAHILKQLSDEYSLWENMQNNVSLSLGDMEALETDRMMPKLEEFLETMEKNDNFSLSLVIDKSILLNKEEYGGYDHIIMTDRSWIETFDIGVDKAGKGGQLTSVELDALDKPLQEFIEAQMPLWTKTEEIQPEGVAFYEFEGKKFLALPPNVAYGGTTVQANNPLIILVDRPTEILNTSGFTLPACSSGNVVFPNEQLLREELSKSPIKESVVSIDSIAEIALAQAKQFEKEAVYYVIACILIFVSMIFAGVLTAQLWVNDNKKKIFLLHTFGKTYKEIIQPIFLHETRTVLITIVVGSLVSFFVKRPEIITLLIVAILLLLLYSISSLMTYNFCARRAFYKVAQRKE